MCTPTSERLASAPRRCSPRKPSAAARTAGAGWRSQLASVEGRRPRRARRGAGQRLCSSSGSWCSRARARTGRVPLADRRRRRGGRGRAHAAAVDDVELRGELNWKTPRALPSRRAATAARARRAPNERRPSRRAAAVARRGRRGATGKPVAQQQHVVGGHREREPRHQCEEPAAEARLDDEVPVFCGRFQRPRVPARTRSSPRRCRARWVYWLRRRCSSDRRPAASGTAPPRLAAHDRAYLAVGQWLEPLKTSQSIKSPSASSHSGCVVDFVEAEAVVVAPLRSARSVRGAGIKERRRDEQGHGSGGRASVGTDRADFLSCLEARPPGRRPSSPTAATSSSSPTQDPTLTT